MPLSVDIRKKNPDKCLGKEVAEIKPVMLGGSPTDPENKTLLSRKQHIQVCNYWNKVINDLKSKS